MVHFRALKLKMWNSLADEDGALTVLNLFLLCAIALLGGIAIDVANVVSARTQLQATADAAAHAALVEREWHAPEEAKTKAIAIALENMPKNRYGNVLKPANIVFGDYDRASGKFTARDTSRNAVYVQTEQLSANSNAVGTFLLQFAGLWGWDVRARTVFETYTPACLREGFVAENVIDVQSNNSYFNGFCVHSNRYVTINNNNFFEPGTVVSMPDTNDMVVRITGNETDKNVGLKDALREGKWFIKILNRIAEIKNGVQTPNHRYARNYTTNFNVVNINTDMPTLRQGNKYVIAPTNLNAGRVYAVDCNKVDLKSGTFSKIVLITNCPIEISNGVTLIDVVLISTYSGAKALYSPAKVILGQKDNCAPGGGAQIVTYGSVDFSAGLEIYGGQIIAGGSVEFSSNADGMQGASIVAGGRIDSTSNMNFGFCGRGMEQNFLAEYFRLAE